MVMKRNAMRRNLRQSIIRLLGRYIAIAMIIALGAALFVGLLMTKADMVATGQRFMEQQNMFDLRLMNSYGWEPEHLDKIRALESKVDKLEEGIRRAGAVTPMLEQGMTPEDILGQVCGELGVVFMETTEVSYKCYCSRERVTAALVSLGKKELTEIMEEGNPFPVECQFCDTTYEFTSKDIEEIIKNSEK